MILVLLLYYLTYSSSVLLINIIALTYSFLPLLALALFKSPLAKI